MSDNRNYIIDRIKSKTMSIDEFNYDRLQAPPLSSMFTPLDIQQLNRIASSIRYSGNPELRFQEIDKIMRRRGFVKFVNGTNRIVYRPIENNTFLVKVALDAVGLGDNPREFVNQQIFKPFVTKVFEISPCGTIGIFERVVPITSREEFLSVAPDIFEVINKWFIGEYILEDIGTNYFLNWGIRKGFGPVLLDFPYVYKLDGDKLFCNAPDIRNPSGCCEGVIDYDPGYNYLYCTKCGVKYKAKELEKAVEENKIIVKSEGDFKMKVVLKGGSKNVEKSVATGEYAGMAKAIPTRSIIKGRTEALSNTKMKAESNVVKANLSVEKEKEKKEETPVVVASPVKEEVKEKKESINPISIDESLINKEEENKKVVTFEDCIDFITNCPTAIKDEIGKKCFNISSTDEAPTTEVDELSEKDFIVGKIIDSFSLLDELDVKDTDWTDIVGSLSLNSLKSIINTIMKDSCYVYPTPYNFGYNEDTGTIDIQFYPNIATGNDENRVDIWNGDETDVSTLSVDKDTLVNILNDIDSDNGSTFGYWSAKVINVKDILPDEQPYKIIVLIDADGNYYKSADGSIIAIDMVDDRSVQSTAIVSEDWLNNILSELEDKKKSDTEDESAEEENSDVTDNGEVTESVADHIPVGVLPPKVFAVNGVADKTTADAAEEQ